MPIYEYECENCGKVQEVFQKFSDAPITRCSCGGRLKKLISLNSFHLKGSGWYVTDYGRGQTTQSCSKTESPAESKPETKAESKAEAKTDSKPDSSASD